MIDMKLFISTEIFVLDCKPDYLYYDYLLFQSNLKCTFSGKSIMLYCVMFNFTLFASMHSIEYNTNVLQCSFCVLISVMEYGLWSVWIVSVFLVLVCVVCSIIAFYRWHKRYREGAQVNYRPDGSENNSHNGAIAWRVNGPD